MDLWQAPIIHLPKSIAPVPYNAPQSPLPSADDLFHSNDTLQHRFDDSHLLKWDFYSSVLQTDQKLLLQNITLNEIFYCDSNESVATCWSFLPARERYMVGLYCCVSNEPHECKQQSPLLRLSCVENGNRLSVSMKQILIQRWYKLLKKFRIFDPKYHCKEFDTFLIRYDSLINTYLWLANQNAFSHLSIKDQYYFVAEFNILAEEMQRKERLLNMQSFYFDLELHLQTKQLCLYHVKDFVKPIVTRS